MNEIPTCYVKDVASSYKPTVNYYQYHFSIFQLDLPAQHQSK